MAFLYFMGHAPGGFLPINYDGEFAVIFSFVFLYLSASGSGKFSLGGMRGN